MLSKVFGTDAMPLIVGLALVLAFTAIGLVTADRPHIKPQSAVQKTVPDWYAAGFDKEGKAP